MFHIAGIISFLHFETLPPDEAPLRLNQIRSSPANTNLPLIDMCVCLEHLYQVTARVYIILCRIGELSVNLR